MKKKKPTTKQKFVAIGHEFKFNCPNCGKPFEQAEDKHSLKPSCSHFPKNIRLGHL